jgi:hypothetical protein
MLKYSFVKVEPIESDVSTTGLQKAIVGCFLLRCNLSFASSDNSLSKKRIVVFYSYQNTPSSSPSSLSPSLTSCPTSLFCFCCPFLFIPQNMRLHLPYPLPLCSFKYYVDGHDDDGLSDVITVGT